MKVFSIVNQKGGVAKTTTALNLVGGLSKLGYKTLAVDLDPQQSLSNCLQASTEGATALNVLLGEADIKKAIVHTPEADVLPAGRNLAQADSVLTKPGKEYRLKEALSAVKKLYDFVVIDTSPALGTMTVNAIVAADALIIPAIADRLSLEGIGYLMETVAPIKKYFNTSLKVEGILLTQFEGRAVITREITDLAEQIAAKIDSKVFTARIRRGVAVKESQARRQSLFAYNPACNPARDYMDLINELLKEG